MVIVILLISGGTSRGCRIVRRVLLLVVVTAGIVTVAGNEIDWGLTTLTLAGSLLVSWSKNAGGKYTFESLRDPAPGAIKQVGS